MLCEKFMVVRTDDNGSMYLMQDDLTEDQADTFLSRFRGHKQSYSKIAYRATTRAQVISDNFIIE